jgi:hypothetical protein
MLESLKKFFRNPKGIVLKPSKSISMIMFMKSELKFLVKWRPDSMKLGNSPIQKAHSTYQFCVFVLLWFGLGFIFVVYFHEFKEVLYVAVLSQSWFKQI